MLPFLLTTFLKDRILNKTFFVCLFTFISLIIYLFILLGCISKGVGIENLYWVMISQNGTAGQLPVEVRIGYFDTSLPWFGSLSVEIAANIDLRVADIPQACAHPSHQMPQCQMTDRFLHH
jgi:hypothetical protein